MGRAKQIIFLNKEYSSQKEFEKFIKEIIYEKIKICNDIKNKYPEEYKILVEFLKRHPTYDLKTKNMCNLKISSNKLNKKALEILILNNDKTEIDISWNQAIKGGHKTHKSELVSAMRSSIELQIINFKNNNEKICSKCGSDDKIHIDHYNPQFNELTKMFIDYIKEKNIKIPTKFDDMIDKTNRRCFKVDDKIFEKKWKKYHKKKAELRVLCSNCNLTRSKTKNNITL